MEVLFELRRRALGARKGLTPATLQNTSSSLGELNVDTAERRGLNRGCRSIPLRHRTKRLKCKGANDQAVSSVKAEVV